MEVRVEEPAKDPLECRPTMSEAEQSVRKADGRRDAVAGM
jgi:hypothetical protein